MEISGRSLIGGAVSGAGRATFHSLNPATGEALSPAFHAAGPADVTRAASLASEAAPAMARLSGAERARFLREIATRIADAAPSLVDRAAAETALTVARLSSETVRTTGQLRLFADVQLFQTWTCSRHRHASCRHGLTGALLLRTCGPR